jgi:hypothetical protein
VVLFQKAACVQSLDKDATITVSDDSFLFGWPGFLDDGPDVKYFVSVASAGDGTMASDPQDDVTLKLVSLKVHYVSAVKVETRHSEILRFPETKPERSPETPGASSDDASGASDVT